MTVPGSVTRWVRQLEEGDRAAVQRLWETYFDRLVRMARQKLQGLLSQVYAFFLALTIFRDSARLRYPPTHPHAASISSTHASSCPS